MFDLKENHMTPRIDSNYPKWHFNIKVIISSTEHVK